jgi:hypothetical protein
MWENQTIELGSILENSTHDFRFIYNGDLEIKEMTASCGCTKPVHKPEEKAIEVTFKAGKVPKHLRYKGMYVVNKQVKVFTPQGKHILEVKATITMKHVYDR